MSHRRCTVPAAARNPDEPGFEVVSALTPTEVPLNHVLLKVLACGVCHSDLCSVLGLIGCRFPAVPGHEVVGKVVQVADEVDTFGEGDVVGVGWHGHHCLSCEACSDGDFACCERLKITGLHLLGGYQEYMIASVNGLAKVPVGMEAVVAAPLMCAGVTVFNALRNNIDNARPPGLIAVVGIGGLGHLAIQYAAKMGYTVAAVSRDASKRDQCMDLGATHFIDSKAERFSDSLQAIGGASVILCTAPSPQAMSDCVDGLRRYGKLVLLGSTYQPMQVASSQLIKKRRSIVGWSAGTGRDSQDALEFAHAHGIVPRMTIFEGVEKAPDAYKAMRDGEYKVVIRMACE